MGEKTSQRRINHKTKDPLAHEHDEDTVVPKWKAYKEGRKNKYDGEDEQYD